MCENIIFVRASSQVEKLIMELEVRVGEATTNSGEFLNQTSPICISMQEHLS